MPRAINIIVIHCSATPNDSTLFQGKPGSPLYRTPAQAIDGWHADRGFHRDPKWMARFNPHLAAIGYHYVIARNGTLFTGRHPDEIGAHAYGWNRYSLGICMVGVDDYTPEQYKTLKNLLLHLSTLYYIPLQSPRFGTQDGKTYIMIPGICGHRDLSPDVDGDGVIEMWEWLKTCPGFDVAEWLESQA